VCDRWSPCREIHQILKYTPQSDLLSAKPLAGVCHISGDAGGIIAHPLKMIIAVTALHFHIVVAAVAQFAAVRIQHYGAAMQILDAALQPVTLHFFTKKTRHFPQNKVYYECNFFVTFLFCT